MEYQERQMRFENKYSKLLSSKNEQHSKVERLKVLKRILESRSTTHFKKTWGK